MTKEGSQTVGPSRTLGPVSDLERHLPEDWWMTLFNAVYLKTDGDVVENEPATAHEVNHLVRAVGLQPNDRILDLCCGQGRHALELARRGFRHITAIDRSRYLIRLARRRARQAGLNVTFREGDARRVRVPEGSFHCVTLLGNSFGYFDRVEDDVAILESVKRALMPGGTLALDLSDGDWMRANHVPRSWEWIDENHFVCRERSLTHDGERLISREVVVHAERGVIADQFYAERLYSVGAVSALLRKVGFDAVAQHDPVMTESDRNQDLGMMAHRFFVVARAPRRAVLRAPRPVPFPDVTVVMGDARRRDTVKLEGRFNAEDMETIARLDAALAELGEYRFTRLDNHASLMADLRAARPEFVLNLCDEGFENDAFRELHVPALLDMYGIPYSGAGPSCLGLCYDKSLVRAIAQSLDVPVPLETFCSPDDQAATIPSVFPALIKPACGDSSIGITRDSVVHTPEEAIGCIRRLQEALPGRAVLIQEYLEGVEYSIALIGNPGIGLQALPPLEVDFRRLPNSLPKILSYESKWDPASPYWTDIGYREADTDDETRRRLVDYATALFERTGCRDYARFDFRADGEGMLKLLEVNPNPGWCWDGKFNLMAEFAGLRYADLLRMIIEAAQQRVAAGTSRPAGRIEAEPAA